jgi:hypothetical protein
MRLGEPASKKTNRIIWGFLGFLILLSLISFWPEIRLLSGAAPPVQQVGTPEKVVLKPELFLFCNCFFGFFVVFLIWVGLISFQALLPITDFFQDPIQCIQEAYRASWHLLLHIIHRHGPAIFVKDGKENSTSEDVKREGPGVVVVDFNSAVVLEERNLPPGLSRVFRIIWLKIRELLKWIDAKESPRVRGPGIVFTRPRERIRGVVDLRKQFRMEFKVPCYTREGIELQSNVLAMFTIGQDPDILHVTYIGEPRPENLRVVTLDKRPDGHQRVTNFADELDEEDRREIHEFAQRTFRPGGLPPEELPAYQHFSPLPQTNRQVFNRDRVFSAVFAQARNSEQEELSWMDLPTRVAASMYREQLLQINYDELYDVREEREQFPLPGYKGKLRLAMRNNGILAFRLIFHHNYFRDHTLLIRGRIYREDNLLVSQACQLKASKVLRDRGIKVVFSGFGDPAPVNPRIYDQRLDSWRASWAQETEINLAGHDLEAARLQSRAHADAQQDLWRSLSIILNQQQLGEEALALRIFQALDQAATDPKTQALLPGNTIDLMRQLNTLLLPDVMIPQITPPAALSDETGGQNR